MKRTTTEHQQPRYPCAFCGAPNTAMDAWDLCDTCRVSFNDPRPGDEAL